MKYKGGSIPRAQYAYGLTPLENRVMRHLMNGGALKHFGQRGKRALARVRLRMRANSSIHAMALYCGRIRYDLHP